MCINRKGHGEQWVGLKVRGKRAIECGWVKLRKYTLTSLLKMFEHQWLKEKQGQMLEKQASDFVGYYQNALLTDSDSDYSFSP